MALSVFLFCVSDLYFKFVQAQVQSNDHKLYQFICLDHHVSYFLDRDLNLCLFT